MAEMILSIEKDNDEDMLALWDCKSVPFDTVKIASIFSLTEAEADRRLWRAREQRRIKRREVVNEFA